MVMVDIKMELPLALAIKLASAAADIQIEADCRAARQAQQATRARPGCNPPPRKAGHARTEPT